MLKNKNFAIGFLSFALLYFGCLGCSGTDSKFQELTPEQEIKLKQAINGIKEARAIFGKFLKNYVQTEHASVEAVEAFNKAEIEEKKFHNIIRDVGTANIAANFALSGVNSAYKKSKTDYFKSGDDEHESWDAYNEAKDAYYEARDAYMEGHNKLSMQEQQYYVFYDDFYTSKIFLLDCIKNLLFTSKKVDVYKKKVWTKLNDLLKVVAQSLEKSTYILNIKTQKKLFKNYYKISLTLKENLKKYNDNVALVNKKIDSLNSSIIHSHELYKISELSLAEVVEAEKSSIEKNIAYQKAMDVLDNAWDYVNGKPKDDHYDKYFQIQQETANALKQSANYYGITQGNHSKTETKAHLFWLSVLNGLEKFLVERDKVEKRERPLKKGLLRKTKKMFKSAIQCVGKEPMAQEVYQEALKADEEIDKFYQILNKSKTMKLKRRSEDDYDVLG